MRKATGHPRFLAIVSRRDFIALIEVTETQRDSIIGEDVM